MCDRDVACVFAGWSTCVTLHLYKNMLNACFCDSTVKPF